MNDNVQKGLHFNDIVCAALDNNESSQSVIELIKLMKNEVHANFFDDPHKEFSLRDLFKIFV